jgi:hypothetical protein
MQQAVQISVTCWECLFLLVEWLAPRVSSTLEVCQTWIVRVGEVLDLSCSSCWRRHLFREEFVSAPIHPPLWSPVRSFKWYQSRLQVFRDSNQSKIQRWCTRNGDRVLRTSMERTTRCGRGGWLLSSVARVGSFGMSR